MMCRSSYSSRTIYLPLQTITRSLNWISLKHKWLFFVFAFILTATVLGAQETGFPIIRNYTPKEYNGSPQVFGALQDNRGVMYFAVDGGIMEYDGVSWRFIPNEKQAFMYDLAMDGKGKTYAGGVGEFGYLKTDKTGNTIYQSLIHLQKNTSSKIGIVWTVKLTSKYVYFLTYEAIYQYSSSPEDLHIFNTNTTDTFLGSFVEDDVYYVRQKNIGLMKIENNEMKPALQSEYFKSKNAFIHGITYDSTTKLIPTRTEGLFLYQPNKDTIPEIFTISKNDFLIDNNIYNAFSYHNKYFVLGSLKKGGILFDKHGTVLQEYNENNLLQTNQIYRIITDNCQNLWFGLSNGISKTEHSQDLSCWNTFSGLKGSVLSIIRFNGRIYIATNTNIYFIDSTNHIKPVKNIPVGQNWCFIVANNNKSLLAGTQYGIYDIKGDKAERIFAGVQEYKIYQSISNPDRIITTDAGNIISFKTTNDKWEMEGKWEGIKDYVREIIEDNAGNIWLGTAVNGVIRVIPDDDNITKPKKVTYYNRNNGLDSVKNMMAYKIKNTTIWATEKGLYVYNSKTDRFDPYCELGERFCNGSYGVASLIEMTDGKIWIFPLDIKKSDIGYLQPNSNGGYDWVYAPFRRIPEMTIEAFFVEPSGIAWIGGNEGLYRYDINKDTKNYKQSFNCLIRKVTFGSENLLYGGNETDTYINKTKFKVELKYIYNSLKFEFAAPFFDQEERTLFSCQLVGFDKEWSKWDREPKKEYTNLPEGNYDFKVRAKNVYGTLGHEAVYSFCILPPWYRTLWAYVLWITGGLFALIGIIYLYTLRLRRQKAHLEDIVTERTQQLSEAADQLRDASLTDPLTGLRNRRFISEILQNDASAFMKFKNYLIESHNQRRSSSDKDVFGLFMLDMDHFKQVNDTYGHEAGDQVLKQFAEILKSSVRLDDVVIRLGGEEFLVVLKKTHPDYLHTFASKLLQMVAKTPFDLGEGTTLHKTCSIGYTSFPVYKDFPNQLNFEQSIMVADLAMYYAKNHGRNQTVYLEEGPILPTGEELVRKTVISLEFALQEGYLQIDNVMAGKKLQ